MNTAKLRGKMCEMSVTQAQMASKMGMSIGTFSRKLNAEHGDTFTVRDANIIYEMLSLSADEMFAIFFAQQSA